ncbi:hypothetical protein IEQ_00854 [Bacillus cereus BAG6X1-2]|nr:hypothetical protein IEQ_00854 [Bacillus cereus BAG6X1-2]
MSYFVVVMFNIISLYFRENGADALNLYGEYTSLNKEELEKLREKMSVYYLKMILGLVS